MVCEAWIYIYGNYIYILEGFLPPLPNFHNLGTLSKSVAWLNIRFIHITVLMYWHFLALLLAVVSAPLAIGCQLPLKSTHVALDGCWPGFNLLPHPLMPQPFFLIGSAFKGHLHMWTNWASVHSAPQFSPRHSWNTGNLHMLPDWFSHQHSNCLLLLFAGIETDVR